MASPCGAVLSRSRSQPGQVPGRHQKMRCRLRGCSRSRSRGPLRACIEIPLFVGMGVTSVTLSEDSCASSSGKSLLDAPLMRGGQPEAEKAPWQNALGREDVLPHPVTHRAFSDAILLNEPTGGVTAIREARWQSRAARVARL